MRKDRVLRTRQAAKRRRRAQPKIPELPQELRADEVVDRMRQSLRLETDVQLAEALDVSKTTIASWRARNSIPYEECVRVAVWGMSDLYWLLTGQEYGTLKPGLWEGTIDPELLAVVLYDELIELGVTSVAEGPDKAASHALHLCAEYNRYEHLMRESLRLGKLSRADFLETLRRSIESMHPKGS